MKHLRNLTLASAKHLLKQGHISKATHKKIIKKAGGKMPVDEPMPDEASAAAMGALSLPPAAMMAPGDMMSPPAPMGSPAPPQGMLGPMLGGM